MRNNVSMFNKSQNVEIKDSSLTVNVDTSKQGILDRLFHEVAPNAILNAGGRADDVRCYPGTREEVIGTIERSMDAQAGQTHRMLWLSGPAGAGKSAIAQTVAERCRERSLHAANFFFFRGDRTRNRAQPLVATLVYQLLGFYPDLREPLMDCLTEKPLAYKASIEEQFLEFISSPIQLMRPPSFTHTHTHPKPIIIIVDGLDECADNRKQEQILQALHALVEDKNSPFRVLVASRAEHHLAMCFNRIGTSVQSIFLDSEYRPQDDIRRFVIAKFDEIKKVHPLAHTLDQQWPATADIDTIVDKSSGQFIYAATVMRFIQHSAASPALSLLTVFKIYPSARYSPFAQLDAVYSYIFAKTRDIHAVKLILGANSMIGLALHDLLKLVGYGEMQVRSAFADLTAVVQVVPGPVIRLIFYHASLADYLGNRSRSEIYYVDVGEIATELSVTCLKKFSNSESLSLTILTLSHVGVATNELSESLLDASTRRLNGSFSDISLWNTLMRTITRLYFKRDFALFKVMLQSWVRFAYINYINISSSDNPLSTESASRYYKWYQATEWVKYTLRQNR